MLRPFAGGYNNFNERCHSELLLIGIKANCVSLIGVHSKEKLGLHITRCL